MTGRDISLELIAAKNPVGGHRNHGKAVQGNNPGDRPLGSSGGHQGVDRGNKAKQVGYDQDDRYHTLSFKEKSKNLFHVIIGWFKVCFC